MHNNAIESFSNILKEKKYSIEIYAHIFDILSNKYNLSYTTNSNGIFFEFNKEHDEIASELMEYIQKINISIIEHNKIINQRENTQNKYKQIIENSKRNSKTIVSSVVDETSKNIS